MHGTQKSRNMFGIGTGVGIAQPRNGEFGGKFDVIGRILINLVSHVA